MEINWEQRRYETAKEIASHVVVNWRREASFADTGKIATYAIYVADSLIKELKALNESE